MDMGRYRQMSPPLKHDTVHILTHAHIIDDGVSGWIWVGNFSLMCDELDGTYPAQGCMIKEHKSFDAGVWDGTLGTPWWGTLLDFAEGGIALNMTPPCYSYLYVEPNAKSAYGGYQPTWSSFTRVHPPIPQLIDNAPWEILLT